MKQLDTKLLGLALVMAALFVSVPSWAQAGPHIWVYPDTVAMTTAIGTSTDASIFISDGRDTSQNLPLGTVQISLSGSSQFALLSGSQDTTLQFLGYTSLRVRYTASSDFASVAEVTVVGDKSVGDSNTAYVRLEGTPITHVAPTVSVVNYDTLRVGQKRCEEFSVSNLNADSIQITSVTLTNIQTTAGQYSLDNIVTLPATIAGHGVLTMGQICALATSDTGWLNGMLKIVYNYGIGIDSVMVGLGASVAQPQTACVAASDVGFGSVEEGTSVTKPITFTNTTFSAVTLDSVEIVGGDYAQFTINSSKFPLTIPAGSSDSASITFAAPSASTKDYYSSTFEAAVHGISIDTLPCRSLSVPLTASVFVPIVDSITLDAPPGLNTISITAHTPRTLHAIFIHNSGTAKLMLETLVVSTPDTSLVLPYFGTYGEMTDNILDTLGAGSTTYWPILLTLDANDTGTYNLTFTLNFIVQQAHQKGAVPTSSSYTYTVVAHRLPAIAESVSEPNAPAPVDFTLSPNPTRDEVTIGLPDNGPSTVEIYDVLGHLVMSRVARGELLWNGESNTGALANGTYIVRVSQGNRTSSKRLVIVR